jgi:hypothetical protein
MATVLSSPSHGYGSSFSVSKQLRRLISTASLVVEGVRDGHTAMHRYEVLRSRGENHADAAAHALDATNRH